MFFHHYSEVNKLREKFAQSVKNKGQIRSSIWGVGFYSGFWPEYIPLIDIQSKYQVLEINDAGVTGMHCNKNAIL